MKINSEELYDEFHFKVLHYIQSKVNDYYLAEDLCSDVFVKIYENIDKYDENKASLNTWIFTIVRNNLIDYYRARKVTTELPEDLAYEQDDTILTQDNLDKLAKSLETLNETERKIIVLHYYSDKKLTEIASELGISYIYVKVLHKKALAKLQNAIDLD